MISGQLGAYDDAFSLTPLMHPAGRLYLSGRLGAEGAEARVIVRATDVALATQRVLAGGLSPAAVEAHYLGVAEGIILAQRAGLEAIAG